MSAIAFRGPNRERGILLIAGSLEDWGSWFIDPKGSGRRATSGLGPAKKIPCPVCTKRPRPSVEPTPGLVVDRFGRPSPCPVCTKPGKRKGSGRVDADSTLEGDVVVQSVDTTAAATRPPKTRLCLDCSGDGALPNGKRCRSCRGEGRVAVGAFVLGDAQTGERDPLDAYQAAIERRDKSGSYREFVVLEAELRARSPHLLRPFRALHMDVPRAKTLPAHELGYARSALRFFVEWMPAGVRVPRWVVVADERARSQPKKVRGRGAGRTLLAERDASIRDRFRSGERVKEIALSAGLSVARVNEIVYREREVA